MKEVRVVTLETTSSSALSCSFDLGLQRLTSFDFQELFNYPLVGAFEDIVRDARHLVGLKEIYFRDWVHPVTFHFC